MCSLLSHSFNRNLMVKSLIVCWFVVIIRVFKYVRSLQTQEFTVFLCVSQVSHVMRKPALYICIKQGADKLYGNPTADQRLSCRYIDSTTPLLLKSEISIL